MEKEVKEYIHQLKLLTIGIKEKDLSLESKLDSISVVLTASLDQLENLLIAKHDHMETLQTLLESVRLINQRIK